MRWRDPLLLPAIALTAGVVCGPWLSLDGWQSGLALGVFAAAGWLSRYRAWYLAGACLFAGTLAERWSRPGAAPEIESGPGELLVLSGCVVEPPVFYEGRQQFLLELEAGARVRVQLYPRPEETPPDLAYGQRVELEARLRKPRNFGNPGAFDFRGYLARRHIYWTAAAKTGVRPVVLAGHCGHWVAAAAYRIRGAVLDRVAALFSGDAYAIAVHQALLVGESSRLERVWMDDFRRTGTYHALVISGLHISLLAGALLGSLRLLGLGRDRARFTAVVAVWLYVAICGWQTPVVRAAGGFTLYACGAYFHRRTRLLNLLAALAIAFLLGDPPQATEASFQMTFLSVLALGALAVPAAEATLGPYRRALRDLNDTDKDLHLEPKAAQFRIEVRLVRNAVALWCGRRLTFWMAPMLWLVLLGMETAILSAAVQLGLALPMVLYFHRLSLSGLLVNPPVTALLTIAVPVALVAVVTGWDTAAMCSGALVEAARRMVHLAAAWEPAWRVPDPPLWLALSFCLALAALAVWRRMWLLAPVLALLVVILGHPFEPVREPGTLELTMIDVGQGESLLVGTPEGRWMVVDGGGIPLFRTTGPRPRMDIGEDVVTSYLLTRSIRRIDVLVSTHQHEDHSGGLLALLDNFRPRELWAGATPPSDNWLRLRQRAEALGVRVLPMRCCQTAALGTMPVDVLGPAADYRPREEPSNDDSIVLRLRHGGHVFLLTGDGERAAESGLVDRAGRVDVLKVAHHGSRTSTGDAFLDRTRPVFALISAGDGNLFRHPHRDVIERLERRRAGILRTDQWGLVTIRSDGRRFFLETHRYEAAARRTQPF